MVGETGAFYGNPQTGENMQSPHMQILPAGSQTQDLTTETLPPLTIKHNRSTVLRSLRYKVRTVNADFWFKSHRISQILHSSRKDSQR